MLLICLFLGTLLHAQPVRQTIDEELLSEIVSAKQDQVRDRVLGNLVTKSVRTTNFTTYNTLYYMVDILLTEKNKSAMAQGLVGEMLEYGTTFAATEHFLKTKLNTVAVSSSELKLRELDGGSIRREIDLKQVFSRIMPTFDEQRARLVSVPGKHGKIKTQVRPIIMVIPGAAPGVGQKSAEPNIASGKVSKYQSSADDVTMDETADPQLVFVNWLLDTMWHCLDRQPKIRELGLFHDDPQRRRFDAGSEKFQIDYNAFWTKRKSDPNAIDPKDRKTIGKAVDDYAVALAAALNTVEDIKNKLGLTIDGFQGLKMDDLGAMDEKHMRAILSLFKQAVEVFRDRRGNHAVARMCDMLVKYVVIDPEFGLKKEAKHLKFVVDVEALILDLESEFTGLSISTMRNSWVGVKPFFSIGMNYGFFNNFSNSFATEDRLGLQEVGWAGEKIGFKFMLWDWGYTRSHRPKELFKYRGAYRRWLTAPSKPTVNNAFFLIYGSGLIYSIADLRTDAVFSSPIVGAGAGLEFFNGMSLNLSYAVPLPPSTSFDEKLNSAFVNVGFDIPIFEYLRAAKEKKAK